MKRIISLLLSIVISISLVGCSSTNKNDDTQEEKTYTSKDDEKVDFDMSIQDMLNKKYKDYVCQVGSVDSEGNTVISIKTNFNAEGIDKDTLLSQIGGLSQFDKLVSDLEKKYEAKEFKGGIYFMLMSKDDVCLYEINHSADKVERDATLYPIFNDSDDANIENANNTSNNTSNNSSKNSNNKKSNNISNNNNSSNNNSGNKSSNKKKGWYVTCPECGKKIWTTNGDWDCDCNVKHSEENGLYLPCPSCGEMVKGNCGDCPYCGIPINPDNPDGTYGTDDSDNTDE